MNRNLFGWRHNTTYCLKLSCCITHQSLSGQQADDLESNLTNNGMWWIVSESWVIQFINDAIDVGVGQDITQLVEMIYIGIIGKKTINYKSK